MVDYLTIRRLGENRNCHPNNDNGIILMNPTTSQFFMRALEVLENQPDHKVTFVVNPSIIERIYFKLFDLYPDQIRFNHGTPDKDTMLWEFTHKIDGDYHHDLDGRAVQRIEITYHLDGEDSDTNLSISLIEHYGGPGNTRYLMSYGDDNFNTTIGIDDKPILTSTSKLTDQYRILQLGMIIFLQAYGWKTVRRYDTHPLAVI